MSQLNFFLTQDEVLERLVPIFLSEDFLIFNGRFFDKTNPTSISKIDDILKFDILTIWVKNNIALPTCNCKGRGDFEGLFLFDMYFDPIVEISNCATHDGRMVPGRLYYKTGWIKSPDLRELHRQSASKIVRVFRKNLKPVSNFNISNSVIKLIKDDGHEIELGDKGKIINKNNLNSP